MATRNNLRGLFKLDILYHCKGREGAELMTQQAKRKGLSSSIDRPTDKQTSNNIITENQEFFNDLFKDLSGLIEVAELKNGKMNKKYFKSVEKLKENDLSLKRPGNGIPPKNKKYLIGREVKNKIKRNEVIKLDNLK